MIQELNLERKKAIVIGSGLLAKASILALAEAGSDIIIATSKSKADHLREVIHDVERFGKTAEIIPTDVTQLVDIEKLVNEALVKLGRIDILVNTPQVEFAKPILEVNLAEWQQVITNNLTSIFLCSKAIGQTMLGQKQGRIINICSGLAERGCMNSTAYCASMGGVLQFTRALSLEWAGMGITVNAIAAGWLSESLGDNLISSESRDTLLRFIPMKRLANLDDFKGLIIYFASDASSFMTGQIISVSGGLMARA